MIVTSTVVMFFLMYLNSYILFDHAWFSDQAIRDYAVECLVLRPRCPGPPGDRRDTEDQTPWNDVG